MGACKICQVTAAAQGKLHIERSSDGTRVFAVPDRGAGAELIDASGRPTTSRLQTLELSELRERVRKASGDKTPRSVAQ